MLADEFREHPTRPFAVAQMLVSGSYVSMETALAFHGWIPEAVYTTSSIVPGRKSKESRHERLGLFAFHPLAIRRGSFPELVRRVAASGQRFLIAEPLRALMDLVVDKSWVREKLQLKVDSIEWKKAAADVAPFLKISEQESLKLWDARSLSKYPGSQSRKLTCNSRWMP